MNFNLAAVEAQEQKLDAILRAAPSAVIAGGYLRDLLLDKPHRDIDIFMGRHPTEEELDALDKLLDCTLFELVVDVDGDYQPEGGCTSDIKAVYRTDDESVNVIVVDDVSTHIREFPDNISKVYYDLGGLVRMGDFIYGHEQKIIKYRLSAATSRLEKLKAKFPDYTVDFVFYTPGF